MLQEQTVAIIGYGGAGVNAAMAMRSAGYAGHILVLSNTKTPPYSPVLTSHLAGGTKTVERCYPWTNIEIEELKLDVVQDCTVTKLLPKQHMIETSQGNFSYTKCLVASGASPVRSGFVHTEGYEPLVLRTLDDGKRLKGRLERPECKHVLVSGTSMVALKVLDACLHQGVSVTLLGRSEHILRRSALPEVAGRFEQLMADDGIDVLLNTKAVAAKVVSHESHEQVEVEFDNGAVRVFDDIVLAHGVTPNLGFVEGGALERDKSLLVDQNMRTSDPDVFAAGDVAQALDLTTGKQNIVGLWENACEQGICAGYAMAAELAGAPLPQRSVYAGSIPNNIVYVRSAVLISAGSVALGQGRRADFRETDGVLVARVFQEQDDGSEKLAGYNVLSSQSDSGSIAYDEAGILWNRLKSALVG